MEPAVKKPINPATSRRLPLFRAQRLVEHISPAPVPENNSDVPGTGTDVTSFTSSNSVAALTPRAEDASTVSPSAVSSPLDEAIAMMTALVGMADSPKPNELVLSPKPFSLSPTEEAGVISPGAVAPSLVAASTPTSPFDPARGAPAPVTPTGAKRMSFAALDALQAVQEASSKSESDHAVIELSDPATGLRASPVTTEQKTEGSVSLMRMHQAIAAATKVKGQLDMAKFGLHNEAQWLLFTPHRYDDYKTITDSFSKLLLGNVAVVKGVIQSKKLYDKFKNETTNIASAVRLLVILKDIHGKTIPVTSFGKPGFAWKKYNLGNTVHLRVKPQRAFAGHGLELANSEIVDKTLLGQIVPIYPPLRVTKGDKFAIEVKRHMGLMDMAVQIVEDDSGWFDKHAPVRMEELTKFTSARELLDALHCPKSVQDGENAMLAAKRLSSYTLVRKTAERSRLIKVNPKSMINVDLAEIESLKGRLPYKLTGDQHDSIDGIVRSLRGPKPMDGLLSGDVGTGKTAAFLLPMVGAYKAGKRVMLLTPNLLLIAQVARELSTYFPEVSVCTVNGKGGIQGNHENSIIIGSTALINAMKKGKIGRKPDFLIVDEQQKFSVEQREALRDTHTNKIEATATPIPRTAALATHGAHDLFMLREMPVQKTVKTEVLGANQGKLAGQAVIDALRRGEQACVIYPLVTASLDENGDPTKDARKSVNGAADNWKKFVALEDIAVLHGKMKDDEKEAVLNDFRSGNKKLLLASIVIEVGVTLPELKTMLVTDADRFGVVTLHQLRGRLARHGGEGHFVLYSENLDNPECLERLNLVRDNTDGFELAEKDAEVRGYGDLLGIDGDNQSGATRALFQGVKIGPRDISFAAHLHEKAISLGDSDEYNQQVKKGQNLRLT